MCRYKLEGVSAVKVCVSESACVSVIKAVYDCFMGGKVPNRFEMLKQMCGSVRNISKMIRLLHDFVLTLQKSKKQSQFGLLTSSKTTKISQKLHFTTRGSLLANTFINRPLSGQNYVFLC